MSTVAIVHRLQREDVADVARLHQEAFPGFFLSALGVPLLREFYRGFLSDPTSVTAVARTAEGDLLGVAVGTTEPRGFFARLLRRRWFGFAVASTRAVVRHPSWVPRLARAVVYRGDPPPEAGAALLSSICVNPGAQGAGVGRTLLEAWTQRAASSGIDAAYLVTDARGNDSVNRFYVAAGWTLTSTYETPEGRPMNRYTKRLAT